MKSHTVAGVRLLFALLALLCVVAPAQITQITAGALINPQVLDFDTGGAPGPAIGTVPVSSTDPYFTGFGLCDVNIVNAPGMHVAGGDTLSSGFVGNALVSMNNMLAIAAPGGPMDNHTAGAGWSFRLAPGLTATQFGALIVDQFGHSLAVETWSGGALQNTLTLTLGASNTIYFEDPAGFDQVRFQNVGPAGGWGIDDFTLANVSGTATGASCPPLGAYQTNSAESSLTVSGLPDPGPFVPIIKSAGFGTPETLDLASTNVGAPFDVGIAFFATSTPLYYLTAGNQILNVDLTLPSLVFLNGGASLNLLTSAFPSASFQIPFAVTTTQFAVTQMVVVDPIHPDGFVLSHAAEYDAQICNASENFDSLPLGPGSAPFGWSNPSAGSGWTVDTGGTPSSGTGPTAAQSGANYLFCEASMCCGTLFQFDTCFIDLTQIPGVTGTLNFALSRIGADIGTLSLFIDDGTGGGFVPITDPTTGTPITYMGPDPSQSQGGVEWSSESIPFLHNVASSFVAIRFSYVSGPNFMGDIALDDFAVN